MAEETIPCPGCKAPLSRARDVCERCRRPWSESDFAAARAAVLAVKSRRTRRLKSIVSGLFLPACVAVFLVGRERTVELFNSARAEASRRLEAFSRPAPAKPSAPAPRAPAVARPKSLPAPKKAVTARPVAAVRPAAATPATPRSGRVARRPPAPPESAGVVRVFGVVYDLDTAAPIPGATVRLRGPGHNAWGTMTDADGFYVVDVPAPFFAEALTAAFSAPGYREGQLEDSPSPYFERAPEMRRALIEQLSPSDLEPLSVRSRQPLRPLDAVLVAKDLAPGKAGAAP